MECRSIFKRYPLWVCGQSCLILATFIILFASSGCMSPLDVNTERKITVIDQVKSPPIEVDAKCQFFEIGLIQDPNFISKVDSYKDEWTYLPKTITALIDTSASKDTISMDLILIADSSNPTRQRLRSEYVTSIRIRLDKMAAFSSHSLIFGPETGEGSLIVTQGESEPEIKHYRKIIVEFHTIEKINKGKNSKLTMEVSATIPSASSIPNFGFIGTVEFQW
ncbi:MAG: hypothetical protein HYZ54_01550 [Ignavibacteriae bacterium]|nr:hypothetical protein [Ignavibacteriota bacterium]